MVDGMTTSFVLVVDQATFSRWLRPRASTALACAQARNISSLVGAERRTDRACGAAAAALGLTDELGDGLRDFVWICDHVLSNVAVKDVTVTFEGM